MAAMPPEPPPALPPHPAVRQSLIFLGGGAGMIVYGITLLANPGGWLAGPIFLVTAGGLIGLGLFVRQSGPAAQAVNQALNLALTGQIAEADDRFAAADARFSLGYVRRVIAINRAWIALRRGDLERAVELAGTAISRPVQWLTRGHDRSNIAEALGIRAVALASLGDDVGAERDIAAILANPLASPYALARAELSKALLLERAGDRAALGAHLAKHRRLLLEHTHPRDRAIVRAYQRMLTAQSTSVYRHGASRDPAPRDEPALSDWVAKLAPGAASFVRPEAARGNAPLDPEPAVEVAPAVAAVAKARFNAPRSAGKGLRVLALWALLVVTFLAIWQFLGPERPPPGRFRVPVPAPVSEDPSLFATLFPALIPALFVAFFLFFLLRRGRAQEEQIRAAQAKLARGDEASALAMFTTLSKGLPGVAGQSLLALAAEMERTGDLHIAETLCDRGIAKSLRIVAAASDFLLPGLFTEHAVIAAAQGRRAEAAAELALIEERYPAYALLDTARFRISLIDRARNGDFAGAARIAEKSADLPLTVRDELLADLVRVIAGTEPGGGGEADRLQRELRGDAVSRAWIEKVAPAALAAFEQVGSEVGAKESAEDDEAERERLAEEEAEPLAKVGSAG